MVRNDDKSREGGLNRSAPATDSLALDGCLFVGYESCPAMLVLFLWGLSHPPSGNMTVFCSSFLERKCEDVGASRAGRPVFEMISAKLCFLLSYDLEPTWRQP
jgi:hypothetical protein